MPAIIFSPKASEDLDEIKAYIESELGSPNVACKKILEILDAIDNLAVFPEIGPSLKGKVDSLSQYQCLSVSNYPPSRRILRFSFQPYDLKNSAYSLIHFSALSFIINHDNMGVRKTFLPA